MTKVFLSPQWKDSGAYKEPIDSDNIRVPRLEVDGAATYVDADGSGNMTFTDAVSGTKTLAELTAASAGAINVFVVSSTATAAEKAMATATYTCLGDSTDSTVINAALTALTSGGKVTLSSGTFNIAAPIMFPDVSYLTLEGMGPTATNLVLADGSNCAMIAKTTPGTDKYRCAIRDIGLDGNKANNPTGTYGLDLNGFAQAYIDCVRVTGTKSHAFFAEDCDSAHFQNLRAVSCDGWAFYVSSAAGVKGNLIYSSGCYGGMALSSAYECYFTNVSLDQDTSEHELYFLGSQRCHVVNLWAAPLKQYKAAIYFYSSIDCKVYSGAIEPVPGADADLVGVYFYAADGTTTSGCVVDGVSIDGGDVATMRMYRETVAGSGTIANCIISKCPVSGITQYRHVSSNFVGTRCIDNPGYIAPGEVRTASGALTAGNANAFAFAWQNPEAQAIWAQIKVEETTAGGTAGALLDVGSAADATTHSDNMIDGADLNATDLLVSSAWVKLDANGGTTDYITGQILEQNAATLAGRYFVKYIGAA